MTAGELKRTLETVPDDYEVVVEGVTGPRHEIGTLRAWPWIDNDRRRVLIEAAH